MQSATEILARTLRASCGLSLIVVSSFAGIQNVEAGGELSATRQSTAERKKLLVTKVKSPPYCAFTVLLEDQSPAPADLIGPRPFTIVGHVSTTRRIGARGTTARWFVDGLLQGTGVPLHQDVPISLTTPGAHTIRLSVTSKRRTTTCVVDGSGLPEAHMTLWPMIHGQAKDESGAGISGTTVQSTVAGTGTSTDTTGRYSLFVPVGWSGDVDISHVNYGFSPSQRSGSGVSTDLRWDFDGVVLTPVPQCSADADCDDGNYCNGPELCELNACVSGVPISCDDGVACTTDACNESTASCDHVPSQGLCDDGDFCNGSEICDAQLGCIAGSDPCLGRPCDANANRCVDCLDASDCDDGLFCNGTEVCLNSTCYAGSAVNCDDGVPCTNDACNEATRNCESATDDTQCDNNVFCDGVETCDAAIGCLAGTFVDSDGDGVCDSIDQCPGLDDTLDLDGNGIPDGCDSVASLLSDPSFEQGGVGWAKLTNGGRSLITSDAHTGVTSVQMLVSFQYPREVFQEHAVTEGVRYDAGVSVKHSQVGGSGTELRLVWLNAQSAAIGTSVVDGFGGTSDWMRLSGSAFAPVGATSVQVSLFMHVDPDGSGVAIFDDASLTEGTACQWDIDCDDGVFCNGPEQCVASVCVSGSVPSCDDGISCTIDACNVGTDACDHQTSNGLCDDGIFCNGAEICDPQFDCTTGSDPCPNRQCDAVADACAACLTDIECDDGVACNGFETCTQGVCRAGVDQCSLDLYCDARLDTCVAVDPSAWSPPIGIPRPSFGIAESHTMYQLLQGEDCGRYPEKCYDFGNGLEAYRDAGDGPYTHYIDVSDAACTDSNNPYGTGGKPRCTIPPNVPAGSVVEMHGGLYDQNTCLGGKTCMGGAGTVSKPIFYRGASAQAPAMIGDRQVFVSNSSYLILENLDLFIPTRGVLWLNNGATRNHHVAIRHNHVHGNGTNRGNGTAVVPQGDQIVVYDNEIHDIGDWQTLVENDYNGISLPPNSQDVWFLDNRIYHMGSDGIGAGHANAYSGSHYYIGRNHIHDNGENAMDFKEVRDVVISQNEMHGFVNGRDGTAVVVHYGPTHAPINLWIIGNEVYNCDLGGIQIGGGSSDEIYVVGNVLHDITNASLSARALVTWSSEDIYVSNNTIYNSDVGISMDHGNGYTTVIENNLISNLYTTSYIRLFQGRAGADMKNNLTFHPSGSPIVNGTCNNCLSVDPQLVDLASDDAHLTASSPAIDAGKVPGFPQRFMSAFSAHYTNLGSPQQADISQDFDGQRRPANGSAAWDVGAFEY